MSKSCRSVRPHRVTRKQKFLEQMDQIVPWNDLIDLVRPFYYEGKRGRPPLGIERMLRMHFLQSWFSLSDVGIEEALLDSRAMASFARIDLETENVPDATTLLKFRRILENHNLSQAMFELVKQKLRDRELMMSGGSIIDATLIDAPSSTKNATGERDPEMCQTKKGNQYYFGMKAHIGVCAGSGYVHSLETTAANVSDIAMANKLIRDDDHTIYGDAGYLGIEKRPEIVERTQAQPLNFQINRRRSKVQKMPDGFFNWEKEIERRKSSVRSRGEHPFGIVKNIFGFTKTAYRGLKKNTERLFCLFTSANLLMCARSGRGYGSL